jgi:hypothetical protein
VIVFLATLPAPPGLSWFFLRVFGPPAARSEFVRCWLFTAAGATVAEALGSVWPCALSSAVNVIAALIVWWLSRRNRKRALKALSARGRAVLAALVKSMRDAAKPRRVFRPAPQGVSLWTRS